MILYFMKQDALEFIKQNINELYTHYYTDDTNEWINEAYGMDAFSIFKEIPDIELTSIGELTMGEVDYYNIPKLYLALRDLSESQAADERLWAGLCNSVFYDYLRKRWKYDEKDIVDAKNDASNVLSRFYFSSGIRGSYFRNSLSKYWWVGKMLYNGEAEDDPFYYLKVIGSADINSKITEIFYNNTFSSNPNILYGIINAFDVFYKKNIYLSEKDIIRPTLQYLNAVGGAILLDALTMEEIKKITVEKIIELLNGKESSLTVYEENDDEPEDIEKDDMNFNDETVSLIDFDELFGADEAEDIFISKGDRVTVLIEDIKKEKIRVIPSNKEKKDMDLVDSLLLGKRVGEKVKVAGHTFIVKKIN